MKYKTIDLCAGIGGIRRGFEMTGAFQNVLSAEIDPFAALTYKHLFGEDPTNDLKSLEFKEKVDCTEYDVLLALSHSDIVDRYTIVIIEEALNVPLDYINECGFETVKVKNYKTNKHIFIRLKESE